MKIYKFASQIFRPQRCDGAAAFVCQEFLRQKLVQKRCFGYNGDMVQFLMLWQIVFEECRTARQCTVFV